MVDISITSAHQIQKARHRRMVGWYILFFSFSFLYLSLLFKEQEFLSAQGIESGKSRSSCRYHGNCPVRQSCQPDGFCASYLFHNKQRPDDLCITPCFEELRADEWFYHGSIPILISTNNVSNGCVMKYQRQRKEKTSLPFEWTVPSRNQWLQMRFRRVVRVDPVLSGPNIRNNKDYWSAICDLSCNADNDCPHGLECLGRKGSAIPPGISELPKTCRLPESKEYSNNMMLVSGSDEKYFDALENFVASAKFWSPSSKIIIYNLGMNDAQLTKVHCWPNIHQVHWQDGIPKSYPPHVHEDIKNYAWKALAINETVHQYKSMFWLDAGVTFTGPIDPIQEILRRDGIFLVKGQDDHMKWRSHPLTYKWFGFDKESFNGGPHFAGGIQGHVYPSRYIDSIVIPNAECALDPSCISPPGSHLDNHRYDQTSLSILAYQNHLRPQYHTEYLAADINQLNENRSEANRFIMYTARGSCNYYSNMKHLLNPEAK